MRRIAAALAAATALALTPATAHAQDPGCVAETEAESVPQKPGAAPLRFGITPGVQTGQLGGPPSPPRTPEDPAQHLAKLDQLRGDPARPFVLRLHRFFWSDGEEGVQRFLALADRYTSHGYLVELQLRYHPSAEQEGDIAAWTKHVRDVVARFGANPGVVAIQVTNEVNLTYSPDSSDGSYANARDALVQGVVAAKDEAVKHGYQQLKIGFNWAYRSDPASETSFWNGVRDKGGEPFTRAVDWIGLDAYPGTFFPPAEAPGEERDGMVNAMSALRCYAQIPGIPGTVPIHVEENGWPTSPTRSEEDQARVLDTLVGAVDDFKGTYNVSDYRWFNLRDGDSTSPNMGVRYGLLRDDYSPKPAFGRYARHVQALSAPLATAPAAAGPRRKPRLSLTVRCRSRRSIRARVGGRDRGLIRSVRFSLDGRRAGRAETRAPFGRRIKLRGRTRLKARVRLTDGRRLTLRRGLRGCTRAVVREPRV
ncbi:MAG TPA: hypothetical protein VF533_05635 [Solirubrobacteraceae bacterium]|jgi:hypothetical protein